MSEPQNPAAAGGTRDPVYSPEEVRPPAKEANSLGGAPDAADLPPSQEDEPGHGSAHEDEGWRAIDPGTP